MIPVKWNIFLLISLDGDNLSLQKTVGEYDLQPNKHSENFIEIWAPTYIIHWPPTLRFKLSLPRCFVRADSQMIIVRLKKTESSLREFMMLNLDEHDKGTECEWTSMAEMETETD